MLLVDERCLQPDLVGADRIVPVCTENLIRVDDVTESLNLAE